MRDGGRSDEDTARTVTGGTLAESKTNRVVFHDRKDRSERGNEVECTRKGIDKAEVEGRKRRALTI